VRIAVVYQAYRCPLLPKHLAASTRPRRIGMPYLAVRSAAASSFGVVRGR
jgi:hypothetical protein